MKKLFLSLALALVAIVVYAATDVTVTVTLTNKQLRGLQYATALENQSRTNQVPPLPALTTVQFAKDKLTDVLSFFADKAANVDNQSVIDKYNALSAPDRATVDQVLH